MSFYAIFIGIFALVGAIFAGTGMFMEYSHREFLRTAQPVQVEVIALHARSGSEGGTTYAPEYRVASGPYEGATHVASMSSSPALYRVGHRGVGRYDPEGGKIALIDGKTLRFYMLFSSLGLGLVLGAIIFAVRSSRL